MSTSPAPPPPDRPGKLCAMISSTALDLPEHRVAVKEACLAAGVFPIGMEEQPARDASGIQTSLEMVNKADLYLGIYAFRYGWVPDGKDISITEMEFNRAMERQTEGHLHEILVFTAHDDHSIKPKDVEADATAQSKLRSFKDRASSGRVRKEFHSVDDLRRLVAEALRDFLIRHNQKQQNQTVTAPDLHLTTTTPNNLPRLQPFFGREVELAAVRDALHPDSRTWGILIDGPGGMGKTSLAVYAAYTCPPGQFDRIIFISIKDREMDEDGPRTLGNLLIAGHLEMLNELARELGQRDIPKAAEAQRIRLLLEALREQKVLLILDNLESLTKADRDQIFAFVNRLPHGCKAILTSRRRIGGGGTEYILEKLDQEAALHLLAELAPRNPLLAKTSEAERITLYRETAGKPLLLRWVAGQIGRGSCRTFTDALHFLRSCPEGNDPLEFIFGDLIQHFTPAEEAILSALTYFSLPAKIEHIATVAGLDEPATSFALRSLANRSLVTPDQEEKEHTLVPFVADFVRHHRPKTVRAIGTRLEQRAIGMIVENGIEHYDRFPILDAAWPSVSPAIPLFLTGDNGDLQVLCDALQTFLEFTGRWDEWLALSQKAEGRAVAAGDHRNAGWRAFHSGMIAHLRREGDSVLAAADRSAGHWRRAGASARERATAMKLSGLGHHLKGDYRAAVSAYQGALDLFRSLDAESKDIAITLNDLAGAEHLAGNLAAAESHYREALRVGRAIKYSEGIAAYTTNLAALALNRQDWTAAEALARECLPLSKRLGRQELIALDCCHLASALLCQGKAVITEALPLARRAVDIFTRLGSPDLARAQSILIACEATVAS